MTGKSNERGCFASGEKGHFRDSCPNMPEPTKGGAKARRLQVSKLGITVSPRSSSRSSRSSRKCLMARGKMSIPSSSDDSSSDDEGEGKPSVDELAEAVNFFEDVCTKQKAQLKTLKNKLISSQDDYKCLLENFETFANLNCELSTKIEQLESNATSSPNDDSLIKIMKYLRLS
jgi:hypothetical protein